MGLLNIDPFGENKKTESKDNIINTELNNTHTKDLSQLNIISLDDLLHQVDKRKE